jgi:hypothetical protein
MKMTNLVPTAIPAPTVIKDPHSEASVGRNLLALGHALFQHLAVEIALGPAQSL